MKRHERTSPTNAISFDLEHWHSATLLRSEVENPIDRIEDSVRIVLDLLRRHDVTATFFVVGEVAAQYPELVEEIRYEGHEIGSHGHTHTPLFELTPEEFEDELSQSATAIRRACGLDPVGFRAPNFSITRGTEWAFRVLQASRYTYDSSVFPVKTPMYGVSGVNPRPYEVSLDDPFPASRSHRPRDTLLEFPLSVVDVGVRIPIAGGFYARVTPARFLKWGIKRLNRRGIPANLYFHPWEFNPDVRRNDVPLHKRFISFHGIERTGEKLGELFNAFDFGPVRGVLDEVAGDEALQDLSQRG